MDPKESLRETWTHEQLERACEHLYERQDVALPAMKKLSTSLNTQAQWVRCLRGIGWLLEKSFMVMFVVFVVNLFVGFVPRSSSAIGILFIVVIGELLSDSIVPMLSRVHRQVHDERDVLSTLIDAITSRKGFQSVPEKRRCTLLTWLGDALSADILALKTARSKRPLQCVLLVVTALIGYHVFDTVSLETDAALKETLRVIWWSVVAGVFGLGVLGLEFLQQFQRTQMRLRVLMSEADQAQGSTPVKLLTGQ